MGIPAMSQSFDKPSFMTHAQWKKNNLRYYGLLALGSVLLISLFVFMLYGSSARQITLVVDGQEETIMTRQWKLNRVLIEQSIAIGPHDRVTVESVSPNSLRDGDRIVIEHTSAFGLIADGRKITVHSTGQTVQEVLNDLRLPLGNMDRTVPELDASVNSGDTIRIVRVWHEVDQSEKPLPFDVVTKQDATLAKGKERVVREGKEGVLVELIENTFEDGALVASRIVDTVLGASSVDKVVAIGSKKPVTVLSASSPDIQKITKKGVTFGVKQVLNGVTLTSYDAGPASTGKDVGHPQYGITFTGTKVEEGRTIAVDPKVIPFGWWVYIEGYGFRRAEDKGSAIKGKKIDVYFDDASRSFGTKKGATVYIIGPKKPE